MMFMKIYEEKVQIRAAGKQKLYPAFLADLLDQSCRIEQYRDSSRISRVDEHKNYINLAIIQDNSARLAV